MWGVGGFPMFQHCGKEESFFGIKFYDMKINFLKEKII